MLSQTQTLNFQAHLFHIPVQNENKLSCVTTRFLWLHYTLYLIFRVSCLHPVYCIPISYLPIIFCEHSYKYSPPLYLSLPPHPTLSSFTPYTSLSLSLPIPLSPTPSLSLSLSLPHSLSPSLPHYISLWLYYTIV